MSDEHLDIATHLSHLVVQLAYIEQRVAAFGQFSLFPLNVSKLSNSGNEFALMLPQSLLVAFVGVALIAMDEPSMLQHRSGRVFALIGELGVGHEIVDLKLKV